MSYHGIIFAGQVTGWRMYLKTIGAYRIRSLCAKQGYNVRVVDYGHLLDEDTIMRICDNLVSKETFFIGLSKTFMMNPKDMKTFELALAKVKQKYPKLNFVLGGAGQYLPKTKNPPWDIRMVGFSDISFVDVLDYMAGKKNSLQHQLVFKGQLNTVYSKNYSTDYDMGDIGTIWLPEDDIKPTDALPIEISRGCIFKCDFCSYELNGKKKFDYFRVKDSLVQELQYNYEQFGVTNYVFLDDTYNDSREKLNLIDDVLSELDFKITYDTFIKPELLVSFPDTIEQLVEQGLVSCTSGIESHNKETRKAISKKADYWPIENALEKLKFNEQGKNITLQLTMIAGLPHEDINSIKEGYRHYMESSKIADDPVWQPFVMMKGDQEWWETEASKIDKDPTKYGYKVYDMADIKHMDPETQRQIGRMDNMLYWENEHTNFMEVTALTQEFMNVARRSQLLSGIGTVGAARCAGVDIDNPNGGIRNIFIDDIRGIEDDKTFYKRAEDYFDKALT
jgi:radical SAM superfamily enzyme YgiQ (UPF0313 family)